MTAGESPKSGKRRLEGAELATAWFVTARAMAVAAIADPSWSLDEVRGKALDASRHSGAGLYAQAVLGLAEQDCIMGKSPERIGRMTLVDCLATARGMPEDQAEKIMTGAMMMAFAQRQLTPLAARFASMLASAFELTPAQFESCCLSGRVLADMTVRQK
ncbi:MAG: hypothetical protein EXS00_06760 [Phycisphaerales bacterium]|nr:hypothetical protein [Phycisphaerales bacterium]